MCAKIGNGATNAQAPSGITFTHRAYAVITGVPEVVTSPWGPTLVPTPIRATITTRDDTSPTAISSSGASLWFDEAVLAKRRPWGTVLLGGDDIGLHREEAPAAILPDGREVWCRHGRLHRDGGRPATVTRAGWALYFSHGKLERVDPPYPGAPAPSIFEAERHRHELATDHKLGLLRVGRRDGERWRRFVQAPSFAEAVNAAAVLVRGREMTLYFVGTDGGRYDDLRRIERNHLERHCAAAETYLKALGEELHTLVSNEDFG